MRAIIAAAVAALVVSPAVATFWAPISQSADGKQLTSIDSSSIGHSGKLTSAWFRTTYTPADPDDGAAIVKTFFVADCEARMMGPGSIIRQRADGSSITNVNLPVSAYREALRPVAPDSVGDELLKAMCL